MSQKNNALDAGGAAELQKQNALQIPDFAPSDVAPRRNAPRRATRCITINSASSGHSNSPRQLKPNIDGAALTEEAKLRKVQKLEEDKLHSEIKDLIECHQIIKRKETINHEDMQHDQDVNYSNRH